MHILTHRVRICGEPTLQQLGLTDRRLRALARAGLLDRRLLHGLPMPPLADAPLASWEPGMQLPEAHQIAWQIEKRRCKEIPVRVGYTANRRTVRFFGGRLPDLRHPDQWGHDMHLAAVFVRHFLHQDGWLSEDHYGPTAPGIKRPDALVVKEGKTMCVESIGRYDQRRIQSFLNFCQAHQIACQLW